MDRLKLFEFIQGENDDGKILDRLKQHVQEGKKLEWFQDIISGLVPGVDESQPWLGHARELLWAPSQRSEHERKIDRMKKLLQPSPQPLTRDRYHLRRHWPVYVEALRPMTVDMLAAANGVYHVVAGQDCLTEDRNLIRVTSETDDKHHAFVAIGMVLQDKILSPVISDIEQRQENLDDEVECAKARVHDLVERLGCIDLEDDQRTADEVECQAAEQRRDDLTGEQEESEALLKALVQFRDVLVAEKDERDRRKNLRRGAELEQPDSDEVRPRKSVKR